MKWLEKLRYVNLDLADGDRIVRMYVHKDRLRIVTIYGRTFESTDAPLEHIDFYEIKEG